MSTAQETLQALAHAMTTQPITLPLERVASWPSLDLVVVSEDVARLEASHAAQAARIAELGAELARLSVLVRDAYDEAFLDGWQSACEGWDDQPSDFFHPAPGRWDTSGSKAALNKPAQGDEVKP